MSGKIKIFMAALVVAVAAAWIVVAAPGWFANQRATVADEVRGEPAPDFVLKDLAGSSFRLSEQRGKPVLLVFGTTWCPACREEIPHLKEIYARYAKRGLVVVNIDIRESRDKASSYAEKNNLPYRLLLDEDGAVAESYGIRGVPSLILLDDAGRVAGGQGVIDQSLANMFKPKSSL
ncbi:MAG: TlpA family protein disulfide reductase [Syntrophales bacterium]|jgi:peroxiredoxin|nr:TlpA family protein disulfide reductase [Syntrophales bacterium]